MNIQTIVLIAALLCAESPGGTRAERRLMAEVVKYRSQVSGLTVEQVIYAPSQFAGVNEIDMDAYQLYRRRELEENMRIVMQAWSSPAREISNYARTGTCWYDRPCEWESRCEIVAEEGKHTFYLCPEYE